MSAFDELKERTEGPEGSTPLEGAVMLAWKNTYYSKRAEVAAEELARLQAIEKAAKRMAECLDVYRWYEDDAAALEEYEKAVGNV